MLSLEMNESGDLNVFDWTTLKWKLREKISVGVSGLIQTKAPYWAPMLRLLIRHWSSLFPLSQRISSCSASVCWYFEEIQWSTFNKPLQNVPHMQTHRKTNKDANKEYGLNCFHMQIHTHTHTHTQSKWPQPTNTLVFFSFASSSLNTTYYLWKNVLLLLCQLFFSLQIKLHWNQNGTHPSLPQCLFINKYS